MALQPHHQRACDESRQEHDAEGQRIPGSICLECIARLCEQEIEHQNTDGGWDQAVNLVFYHQGRHQDPQYIDGDDVGLIDPQVIEKKSNAAGRQKDPNAF